MPGTDDYTERDLEMARAVLGDRRMGGCLSLPDPRAKAVASLLARVRQEEREACATVCSEAARCAALEAKVYDKQTDPNGLATFARLGEASMATKCADTIRARSEPEAT